MTFLIVVQIMWRSDPKHHLESYLGKMLFLLFLLVAGTVADKAIVEKLKEQTVYNVDYVSPF